MQKNYEAEVERNALLETEVSEGVKLKELLQREKDEKRDLKSELEIRTRIKPISEDRKPILPRPEISDESPSEGASLPVPVVKSRYSLLRCLGRSRGAWVHPLKIRIIELLFYSIFVVSNNLSDTVSHLTIHLCEKLHQVMT